MQTLVTIVADTAPAVVIQSPAYGTSFHNGDRVEVVVHATDDLGVSRLGYRAGTGKPQDADTKTYAPAAVTQNQSFAFTVPADAVPGSAIVIDATGVDTKGEQTPAAPIPITVLDSVPPVFGITGVSTGERLLPGQQTTAVVSAPIWVDHQHLVQGVRHRPANETRVLDPARSPVLTSFTFTVPTTARSGDSVRLDATATDKAGNTTSAAQVILPVADNVLPTVTLRTSDGKLEIVPGQTFTVIADAEDEIAVARVQLSGSGAFTLSDAKQVSPPVGSASVSFTFTVPSTVAAGASLTLTAKATDTSNNTSAPATLTLTVRSVTDVTLPASALIVAGETQQVQIGVPGGALATLRIDLTSSDPSIATVPASVTFAPGDTTKSFGVTGVSGGAATITASVQGVARATLTATVRGGIVTGVVTDPSAIPVVGAQITVTSRAANGSLTFSTTTDGDGRYFVEGANLPSITVRAFDPVSKLMGYRVAQLNRANGFVVVDVTLQAAGSISGVVRHPDEANTPGPGARVDLYDLSNPEALPATTFADGEGRYEFGLVPIGAYRLEASDAAGNRGRSQASVIASGQALNVPITFLAVGSVTGVVQDGAGQPVPNAELRFSSSTIFGAAPTITKNADTDGAFRFDDVMAGQFSVTANDPVTNQAGTVSGTIKFEKEVVPVVVRLSNWGALAGTVVRQDGVTPVVGAVVTSHGVSTTTDVEGHYTLPLLPLGPFSIQASESLDARFELRDRHAGHARGNSHREPAALRSGFVADYRRQRRQHAGARRGARDRCDEWDRG